MSPARLTIDVAVATGVIAVGVLVIVFRKPFYDYIRRNQYPMFGAAFERFLDRNGSAFWVGVVGAWAVALGLYTIIADVVRFVIEVKG